MPAERRAEVSRTAGWISPVVLLGGRAVGVWELVEGSTVDVTLWEQVPRSPLVAAAERLGFTVRG